MSPTGRERLCSRRAKYFPEEAQQLSSKLARYVSFVTCRSCAPRSGEEASFRKIGASLDHPPLIGALLAFLIVGGGANSKNWRATHWVFVALRQIFEHRARIQLPTNRVGWLARQFGPLYPRFFNVRSTNVEERPFVGSSLQN